jgi:hypothetical protein
VVRLTLETYLYDVATYLKDQGYGVLGKSTSSTSIQISGYYESTDAAIFLTSYGGADQNEILTGEEDLIRPDFQILVRNSDLQTVITTSGGIYRLLRKKSDWDLGTTHFISLRAKAPPFFVRKTNSGFYEYSINFQSVIQ